MTRSLKRSLVPIALATLTLVVTSCGGGEAPPSQTAATPALATAPTTPAAPAVDVPDGDFSLLGDPHALKGGTYVYWTNSFPTHLNYYGPERDYTLATTYAPAMFNPLISIHPNTLELTPEIASSWEVSGDQKTIVFHLDPDAKWSDGMPITTKDVVATLELIRHPKVAEVAVKVELDDKFPDPPEVIDDHTIKFVGAKSSWRNPLFFADLPIYPAHKVNPETYLDDWRFEVPVVSGQYKLGKYETGKFITFERRNDFWGEGKRQYVGTCNFDTLYYKIINEDTIAFEAMKKGDIDFYLVTKAQRWAEECDFDKIQKGWIQKTRMFHQMPEVPSQMAMNLEHPLFSDVRVRKALFWLFNREYLHDQLFYHQYTNKNSYFGNSIYENPTNEKVNFDPRKGLGLLAEAGWTKKDSDGILMKDGKRLEFDFVYIHPDAERVYTPIQETFRKYGVKMNLKLISPSAWIKVSQEKQFEMIYANWGPTAFPVLRDMWHSEQADKADTSNICHFKNPEVDKLIEQYDLEPDLAKRAEIVKQVDAIVYDACPYLLDWFSDNFRLLWWDKFGTPEWLSYATMDPREIAWKVWWYDPAKAGRLEKAMKEGSSVPQLAGDNTYWKDHKI